MIMKHKLKQINKFLWGVFLIVLLTMRYITTLLKNIVLEELSNGIVYVG